jgi:hypothetical protein
VNLSTFAFLLFVGTLVVAWLIVKALASVAKDTAREMRRQLARRAVDILLAVFLYSWWKKGQANARPRPPVLTGDELARACTLSRWQGDARACRWCNHLIPERRGGPLCSSRCDREWRRNHVFGGAGGAREAALERDHDTCTRTGCERTHSFERSLEVDHIEMARGRHGEISCIHHLDNLRSLCGPHHDAVTAGQRARRWAS